VACSFAGWPQNIFDLYGESIFSIYVANQPFWPPRDHRNNWENIQQLKERKEEIFNIWKKREKKDCLLSELN